VTPARDEAQSIVQTMQSVAGQSIAPDQWVIVSDGSIDGTDELVESFARNHAWIRLIRRPRRSGRNFAAVVENTEIGIRSLEGQTYGYLGLLDADVVLPPHYFERLISQFAQNSRLGLAGGVVVDVDKPESPLPRNRHDVPGAVQFYRRECFERLGGLIPVPEGGWDGLACAVARMRGFKTELFADLVVQHLKPRNSAAGGSLRRKWQMGVRDYAAGYDPLFELVKCVARFSEPPVGLGTTASWLGYSAAALTRRSRVVPADVVRYLRREQRTRLKRFFRVIPAS
jgi:hypothetical protein